MGTPDAPEESNEPPLEPEGERRRLAPYWAPAPRWVMTTRLEIVSTSAPVFGVAAFVAAALSLAAARSSTCPSRRSSATLRAAAAAAAAAATAAMAVAVASFAPAALAAATAAANFESPAGIRLGAQGDNPIVGMGRGSVSLSGAAALGNASASFSGYVLTSWT